MGRSGKSTILSVQSKMLPGPCNKFPFTYVGSGRVAAVKWHLRHKLSDWLRRTFWFSHTHTDVPVHKRTPSILGTVGEIYSGNNLFVAQSDYKKRLRTFINYISYIQWNMVLYLNNCRRQLWYFDSLPRTNGFSPSLACWVDSHDESPTWAVPFTGFCPGRGWNASPAEYKAQVAVTWPTLKENAREIYSLHLF